MREDNTNTNANEGRFAYLDTEPRWGHAEHIVQATDRATREIRAAQVCPDGRATVDCPACQTIQKCRQDEGQPDIAVLQHAMDAWGRWGMADVLDEEEKAAGADWERAAQQYADSFRRDWRIKREEEQTEQTCAEGRMREITQQNALAHKLSTDLAGTRAEIADLRLVAAAIAALGRVLARYQHHLS